MITVNGEPVGMREVDVGFRYPWVGRSEGLKRRVGLVVMVLVVVVFIID